MKILIVSSTCSQNRYRDIFLNRTEKIINPSQKYFINLFKGLSLQQENISIEFLTATPVSASTSDKRIWSTQREVLNEVLKFIYPGFINGKILRHICLSIQTIKHLAIWFFKNRRKKEKVIICDPLLVSMSIPACILAKVFNVKTISIMTDIPQYATSMKMDKKSIISKILQCIAEYFSQRSLNMYDSYVFITDAMIDFIRNKEKAHIVIEGSVDIDESATSEAEKELKVLLYAGGVYTRFGIDKLINASYKIGEMGYCIHIYGAGDAVEDVIKTSAKTKGIEYKGALPHKEIFEKERNAYLLINPRSTREKYTKYSFPSKTLEYMSTGTAVLTTKLSGIPKEYLQYVYLIDEENFTASIVKVLLQDQKDVIIMGKKAREFVFHEKNNLTQGRKMLSFINRVLTSNGEKQ